MRITDPEFAQMSRDALALRAAVHAGVPDEERPLVVAHQHPVNRLVTFHLHGLPRHMAFLLTVLGADRTAGPDQAAGPDRASGPAPGAVSDGLGLDEYGERPRVWLRTGPPPGPGVTRLFDGYHHYVRSGLTGKWRPDPAEGSGEGWQWGELPGSLFVDATRRWLRTDAGVRLAPRPAAFLADGSPDPSVG